MVESKNLKLKLGLCGLALTSFLAINAHSTVHADTVDANQNNAITWDSDQDDSQVVKEDSNQSQPTQNAQEQAPAAQSVQSSVQDRAEMSAVRVSNFDTSTVNRNNAQNARNSADVKVATVHDTSQMPVQKQKVAQFNQGSKIYTLNGSNQLSKNNGDGYVITNAGMYNGRAVDIGVTINNVQNNQGTYTTKWSNGDKADVTGKLDNQFNYQNSVLVTSNSQAVNIDDVRNRGVQITRNRNVTKTTNSDFPYAFIIRSNSGSGGYHAYDDITDEVTDFIDKNENLRDAIEDAVRFNYDGYNADVFPILDSVSTLENKLNKADEWTGATDNRQNGGGKGPYADDLPFNHVRVLSITIHNGAGDEFSDVYGFRANPSKKYTISKKIVVPVTDHLLVDKVNKGSLNYNYTIGVYDAQTGDLITDLKAEYNSKVGVQATAKDSVMNNAIKDKIQQINQNKATVSYTGTKANDDVAFYQETRQVNPQDKNVNRQVQRVIHINFPNGVKPKSYDNITDSAGNKLTLDSNNNLTQSMSFTRTGVQNIVSGQVTYGNWQQHGAINAVTLPAIPGYTMTQTK